ncbi:hypothetical protein ZYGR_0AN00600 [Zygosaccharomyces rouxii]|uniref:Calponin-homology (CH) domain-containing protein n=1 Tax=Zygosaccharomyces rouxii TaxID=4956 RepID=A0A1Q3AFZ3_ZYGRO|nr:hypothetical protein ZYGR_0AN00600 [Zygosaccharomyces rouxii]
MTGSLGSPGKGSVLDRYIKNLSNENSLQPPPQLRSTSQSRLNSFHNLKGTSKNKANIDSEDKENVNNAKKGSLNDKNPFIAAAGGLKSSKSPAQSKLGGNYVNKDDNVNHNIKGSVSDGSRSSGSVSTADLTREEKGYYEFLCRVAEIKQWIERVIGEDLPSEVELSTGDSLRNGVYLATVTQRINPDLAPSVFPAGNRLQFKHTQNINAFFSLVDHVGLPNSFRFELQDLYNKQDLPQVFETLYILITMINKKWPTKTPIIENLSGKVSFSKDDIRKCRKTWPRIRDFKSLNVSSVKSTVGKKATTPAGGGLIQDFSTIEVNEPSSEPETPKKKPLFTNAKSQPILKPDSDEESPFAKKSSTPIKEEEPVDSESSKVSTPEPEPKRLNELDEPFKFEHSISTPVRRTRQKLESIKLFPSPSDTGSLYFSPTMDRREYSTMSPTRSRSFRPTESDPRWSSSLRPADSDIMSRPPHLEYSPLKSTSLSYYSPTISNYLTYDTDFYVRRSQARERGIDFYQTYKYEPVSYSPQRKQRMTEMEFLDKVIRIQSICRGANTRFDMRIQLRLLRLFEKEVVRFQSIIRGNKRRVNIPQRYSLTLTDDQELSLTKLQAYFRSNRIQSRNDALKIRIYRQTAQIEALQSIFRGSCLRKRVIQELSDRSVSDAPLRKLQSWIQGNRCRNHVKGTCLSLSSKVLALQKFQGSCRGLLFRRGFLFAHHFNEKALSQLKEFQERIRGAKVRNAVYDLVYDAEAKNRVFKRLSGILRGRKLRDSLLDVLYGNDPDFANVRPLQGIVRGVLVRYTLDLVDDIIEYNNLGQFQAHVKGYLLRSELDKRSKYFTRNERSVIIIQSRIRTFIQRISFFDLLHHPNPHIKHVRKYAYLLNNTGTIEENQDKLEACQAQLDSENLRKETFEKNIREQLDTGDVLEKFNLTSGLTKELNGMDIPFCRYPTYEKLFFLLQVDPSYWKILYTFEPDFVEKNIYVSFSTVNQRMGRREKIYFIRVLADILQQEVIEARSMHQYLAKPDRFWNRMLRTFLRREYPEVFTVFQPLLKYINNPRVHFESDPLVIYKDIHHVEPLNRSEAIEDEKTKLKFIENLRNLWHSVEMTAEIFTRRLKEIPLEVRFIASKMFTCAADKNTDEIGTLRSISIVLVNSFIFEYMENRSFYGFDSTESPNMDRKLHSFMRALETVFGLGKFTGYYDPLNQYAEEINIQMRELLFNIILDPAFEQEADTLVYRDMVTASPQLEILTEKVLSISVKFRDYLQEFPDDDVIHEILEKKPTSKDFKKNGRIVLDLTASAYRFLVCDDRMRKVYDQVKRAMVYMMQVEDIETNLSDLVVSNVLPEDEPNFKTLMSANPGIKNDPMIKALQSPKYFNMKSSTLKKLKELERSGIIKANSNQLQNFLNDIANTIKNPHYAINYVTEELYLTQETLRGVAKINKQFEKTLFDLRTCVNQAIRNVLKSRDFNSGHKSTLDNLKGAYKKVQARKSDKIEGTMKFKWTTRQLYEKGVIKSIESENLAEQKVKVFGSSGPKFPDINFKISTSDGASYGIQILDKRKGFEKHLEGVDSFTFRELLGTQVGSKVELWKMLNDKVSINTTQLLKLIIEVFLKKEN